MNYLLDTNALNDLLRAREPVKARFTRVRNHARFILSPVVDYEIDATSCSKGQRATWLNTTHWFALGSSRLSMRPTGGMRPLSGQRGIESANRSQMPTC